MKNMFYVVILKTDTPNKPYAIHLTRLVKKFEQKAVFKVFMKKHSEHPKEYYVEAVEKKGKPRGFYSKQGCLKTVQKLAQEHGYFVRYPGNTWDIYKKIVKVRRKPPPNKQFVVEPIPTEELRQFVLESIKWDSPLDEAAKVLCERKIPVFSMKTRTLGLSILFKNTGLMHHKLLEEIFDRLDRANKFRKKHTSTSLCDQIMDRRDVIFDWFENRKFYQKKRNVNEICARLTKRYDLTPGSSAHTVDAVEAVVPSIKSTPVIKVI